MSKKAEDREAGRRGKPSGEPKPATEETGQDTPGRPKSSASRQQTQPNQGQQSGAPAVDASKADKTKGPEREAERAYSDDKAPG
jgi:hypothetical protein